MRKEVIYYKTTAIVATSTAIICLLTAFKFADCESRIVDLLLI